MPRPKHTRKDTNHRAIVDQLRAWGAIVIETADLPPQADGSHPLDLFVCNFHRATQQYTWLQCEVKPDRKAKFTPKETTYFLGLCIVDVWQSSPMPVLAITSAEDVMRWFNA